MLTKEKNMKENKLANLSLDFAVMAVNFCRSLPESDNYTEGDDYSQDDNYTECENYTQGGGYIKDQLLQSATSIGAIVHRANYAHDRLDFISTLQSALKECYKTEYWLEVVVKSQLATDEQVKQMQSLCKTLIRILTASIKTAQQ